MLEVQEDLKPRIESEIKRAFYLLKRYDVYSRFGLLYTEKEFEISEISRYIRVSDRIMKVNKNHYLIIYQYIDKDGNAYKAAQNLIYNLDTKLNEKNAYMALGSFDKDSCSDYILNRLYIILKEVKKSSISKVEFEDILDRV